MTLLTPFERWMIEVNLQLSTIAHVSYLDIPAYDYYDCFESGMTPSETAHDALEAANLMGGDE